jgi:hypothetical protein
VADNQINGQTNGQINGPGRGHQAAGGVGSVKAKAWLQPFHAPDEFNGVPGKLAQIFHWLLVHAMGLITI